MIDDAAPRCPGHRRAHDGARRRSALAAIERGLPVLVEKPLAGDRRGGDRNSSLPPALAGCRSRSGTWSASTRPCSSSDAGSPRAGSGRCTRSRAAGPGRSRRASATWASRSTSPRTTRTSSPGSPASVRRASMPRRRSGSTRATRTCCSGCSTSRPARPGMLDVNWLTPAKRRQLSVVGESGMFELDYLTQRLTFTSTDVGSPDHHRRLRDDVRGQRRRDRGREPRAAGGRARLVPRRRRSGGRPVVDGEDGLWAARDRLEPPPGRRRRQARRSGDDFARRNPAR